MADAWASRDNNKRESMLLSTSEAGLLASGYIRSNSTLEVPASLSKLCRRFYYDVVWTTLKSPLITKLIDYKSDQMMAGPNVVIQGIEFMIGFMNAGKGRRHTGYMQCLVRATHIPDEVKLVCAQIVYFCVQSSCETRSTVIFSKNDDIHRWAARSMCLYDYKQSEALRFGVQIILLHIEYKDPVANPAWNLPIQLFKESSLDWYITGARLRRMKTAKYGQHFYSNTFNNNCFCLAASPVGWTSKTKNHFVVQVKLLRLPWAIESIDVEVRVRCCFLKKEDEWGLVDEEYASKDADGCLEWTHVVTFKIAEHSTSGSICKVHTTQIAMRKCVWYRVKLKVMAVKLREGEDEGKYVLNGHEPGTHGIENDEQFISAVKTDMDSQMEKAITEVLSV